MGLLCNRITQNGYKSFVINYKAKSSPVTLKRESVLKESETKIISFLLVPLYTYVLSTKDYGNLDLVTTTVQLLVPIMTLNIQDAVLRFCLDKEYNPLQAAKVGIRVAGIATAILGFGILIVLNLPFFHLSVMYSVYNYM